MKRVHSLFHLYINSSLHVAAAVASFTAITYLHLDIPPDPFIIGFNFCSTVLGYNFIKYRFLIQNLDSGLTRQLKRIIGITIAGAGGMIYFMQNFTGPEIGLLIFLGSITYFYSHSVFRKFDNLRRVTGVKILIIASIWTGATVLLPGLSEHLVSTHGLWAESFQRLLIVVVLTLPFDIRDIRVDYLEIKTIPQLIGIRNTKVLSFTLLVLILTVEMISPYKAQSSQLVLFLILSVLAVITYRLKIYQPRYFASFWIEGIPVIWLLALYMAGSH